MVLLEIIIPHYKEKEDIIEFNLRMIQLQQAVDFKDIEVCIVNDGKEAYEFSEDFLNQFKPVNIKQIRTPRNGGSGYARNYGMDNTKSKYIMFSDADDGFASVCALSNYFKIIKQWPKADIIVSDFIYEDSIDGTYNNTQLLIQSYSDNTWMHGKMLKRSALEKYDIRFFDDVRYNEDTCFNLLLCSDKLVRVKTQEYHNYITRLANHSSLCKVIDCDDIYLKYAEAIPRAIHTMKSRPEYYSDKLIQERFYDILCFLYFSLFLQFTDANKKSRFLEEILKFFRENFDVFMSLSDEWKSNKFKERVEAYLRHPDYSALKDELVKLTYIDLENFIKREIAKLI